MYLFCRPSSYSYNYYRPTYSAPAPAPAPSFDFSSLLGKMSYCESLKCHVWRHKNTSENEGWEEKWERKSPKKEIDFYDVTRDILGFLVIHVLFLLLSYSAIYFDCLQSVTLYSQLLFRIDGWFFFVKIPYTNEHPVYKYLYLDRRSVSQATTKILTDTKKHKKGFVIFYLFFIFF